MRFLFGLSIWLLSISAFAFNCEGYVQKVAVHHEGDVRIITDFTGNYTTICNTKGDWNEIDTVTCMAWFSQAQAAYSNNKKLLIMYPELKDSANNPLYTCDNLPYFGDSIKPVWVINVDGGSQ